MSLNNSEFTLSDGEFEGDKDAIHRIDKLEKELYAVFVEVERKIDQCEKEIQMTVGNVFREIRMENAESMEAVQLDLELLRQKVTAGEGLEISHDNWNIDNLVTTRLTVNTAKVEKYLSQHLYVRFRLPSAKQKERLPTSLGTSLLFDSEDMKDDGSLFPFEDVIKPPRQALARQTTPLSPKVKTSPDQSPPGNAVTHFPTTQSTQKIVVIACVSALAVSLLLQLLLRLF